MLLSDGQPIAPMPGEAVLIVGNSWNCPDLSTPRTYAALDFREDCTRYYWRRLTHEGQSESGQSQSYHSPRPLSGAGRHVLEALVLTVRKEPAGRAACPTMRTWL